MHSIHHIQVVLFSLHFFYQATSAKETVSRFPPGTIRYQVDVCTHGILRLHRKIQKGTEDNESRIVALIQTKEGTLKHLNHQDTLLRNLADIFGPTSALQLMSVMIDSMPEPQSEWYGMGPEPSPGPAPQ